MKKIYIKPDTQVYIVDLSRSVMLRVSGGDEEENPTDFSGSTGTGEDVDPGEYSRDNNRGSVWDNAW